MVVVVTSLYYYYQTAFGVKWATVHSTVLYTCMSATSKNEQVTDSFDALLAQLQTGIST